MDAAAEPTGMCLLASPQRKGREKGVFPQSRPAGMCLLACPQRKGREKGVFPQSRPAGMCLLACPPKGGFPQESAKGARHETLEDGR